MRLTPHLWMLALLVVSATAAAQETRPEWAWFYGTWDVRYTEPTMAQMPVTGPDGRPARFAGQVEGTAIVRAGRGETPEVSIVFRNPRDNQRIGMRVLSVERMSNGVVLMVRGRWPTWSATFDGKPSPRTWAEEAANQPLGATGKKAADYYFLTLPRGTNIRATALDNPDLRVALPLESPDGYPVEETLRIELTRTRDEGVLNCEWSYRAGPQGMYGRRTGGMDTREKLVRGRGDMWARTTANAIHSVQRVGDFAPVNDENGLPCVQATLRISGWNLPVGETDPKQLAFDDPYVTYFSHVAGRPGNSASSDPAARRDQLDVRVRLAAGISTGAKSFTLNGMQGVWDLRLRTSLPDLRFERKAGEAFQPARMLEPGQTFRIACRFDDDLNFGKRLVRLWVGPESFGPLPLEQDAQKPREYRSDELTVVDPAKLPAPERVPARPVLAMPGQTIVVAPADAMRQAEWGAIEVMPAGASQRPSIAFCPVGRWMTDASITTLTRSEPFSVRLRVPGSQAQTIGQQTDVTFSVRGTSRTATIKLRQRGGRPDAVVYYLPDDPLSIAEGQLDTLNDSLNIKLGFLKTRDGDIVDVAWGEGENRTTASVAVHDTELKRRLAVRRQQLQLLRDAIASIERLPNLGAEDRKIVEAKRRMAANALAIAAHGSLTLDAERVGVLEAYLDYLQRPLTDARLFPEPRPHARFGVGLVAADESAVIQRGIEASREVMRQAMLRMAGELSIGAYEFVAEQTGVGGIYTAITGRTPTGAPVNVLGRVLAGVSAMSSIGNNVLETGWGKDRFIEQWVRRQDDLTQRARARDPRLVTEADLPEAERPRRPSRPGGLASIAPEAEDRSRQETERALRALGLPPEEASSRASTVTRMPGTPSDLAAVGAAYDGNISASTLMQRLNLRPEEVAQRLDEYLRDSVGVADRNTRQRMVRKYLGAAAPVPLDEPADALTRTMPARPNAAARVDALDEEDRLDIQRYNNAFEPARRPHHDRRPMDVLFEEEARRHREAAKDWGQKPEEIERAIQANREQLDRLHRMADRVQDINGSRTYQDYESMRLFLNKGCEEMEAIAGHFFMNRESADPQRIRRALGLSEEQYRQALESFLRRTQQVGDPGPVVDEYLRPRRAP